MGKRKGTQPGLHALWFLLLSGVLPGGVLQAARQMGEDGRLRAEKVIAGAGDELLASSPALQGAIQRLMELAMRR